MFYRSFWETVKWFAVLIVLALRWELGFSLSSVDLPVSSATPTASLADLCMTGPLFSDAHPSNDRRPRGMDIGQFISLVGRILHSFQRGRSLCFPLCPSTNITEVGVLGTEVEEVRVDVRVVFMFMLCNEPFGL